MTLKHMKRMTRTQLEMLAEELQARNNDLTTCLAGFIQSYQAKGGDVSERTGLWAYQLSRQSDLTPFQLFAKLFGEADDGEPLSTRYYTSKQDLADRLAALEQTLTNDQQQLAERLIVMGDQLKSALIMKQERELEQESLTLFGHGLPEPYQTFFFDIIANGFPRWWGEGKGVVAKPENFPHFRAFPGWAWADERATYKNWPANPVRPVSDDKAYKTRHNLIQALKNNIASLRQELAQLQWEQDLAQWEGRTEAEIEVLRDEVWYNCAQNEGNLNTP